MMLKRKYLHLCKLHFLEVVFSHVHEGLHPLIAFAFRAILLRVAID